MDSVVLDASALLVLLNREPGAEQVGEALPGAVISAVNLAEVIGKLVDAGMPEEALRGVLRGLSLSVVPFDLGDAYAAGLLRAPTRRAGLSPGDRACLALAAKLELPALTTDRAWKHVRSGATVRVVGR
ncbi:MAG: type II toxin-antitoxin system VapC family toxin [Planctomycetota bacterium]